MNYPAKHKYLFFVSAMVVLTSMLAVPVSADDGSRGKSEERSLGQSIRQLFKVDKRESNEDSDNNRGSSNVLRSERKDEDSDDDPSVSPTPSGSPTVSPSPSGHKGKGRSCEAHMRGIQRRSEHLARMATNMLNVFDKIAKRVQDYYTTVVLPSGRSVANYDALLTDIADKKAAVAAALAEAQTAAGSFSCTAENPKEDLRQFKTKMKEVKRALHSYRKAIRNLIVAVRTVAPATSPSPSASPSPTPSDSPSPTPTPTP